MNQLVLMDGILLVFFCGLSDFEASQCCDSFNVWPDFGEELNFADISVELLKSSML